jgi:hypothetical protein
MFIVKRKFQARPMSSFLLDPSSRNIIPSMFTPLAAVASGATPRLVY